MRHALVEHRRAAALVHGAGPEWIHSVGEFMLGDGEGMRETARDHQPEPNHKRKLKTN